MICLFPKMVMDDCQLLKLISRTHNIEYEQYWLVYGVESWIKFYYFLRRYLWGEKAQNYIQQISNFSEGRRNKRSLIRIQTFSLHFWWHWRWRRMKGIEVLCHLASPSMSARILRSWTNISIVDCLNEQTE